MHALNPMRARAGLRGHRGLRRRIINFKRQNIGNYIAKLQRHPVRARAGLHGHRGLRRRVIREPRRVAEDYGQGTGGEIGLLQF